MYGFCPYFQCFVVFILIVSIGIEVLLCQPVTNTFKLNIYFVRLNFVGFEFL